MINFKNKRMNKIKYFDIKKLGFKEEHCNDAVFFNEFGYQYTVFTLNLSNRIMIDWDQPTQKAEALICDKDGSVLNRLKIKNLEHLKEVISIFTINKKS